MSDLTGNIADAARQQSIRARCFHPTGRFVEFKKEEIEQSISNRFEEQVRRYPDRLAVKTKNHTLTYDALNRAANRVANAILAQRKEGNEPVGLLLEQGAPMIETILGVLKAGKFYVALDPSFPPERIAFMLEDSQARLIVTNNRNLPLANELTQNTLQMLNIEELGSSLSDQNLGLSLPPETMAYVLYTSGSTGQPKGIADNHRNVLHNIMRNTNILHICADDRLILLRPCSVVGAVRDTFSALLNGASLYLLNIKEEGLAHLANSLIQDEITIYSSVATVFRHFVGTLAGDEQLAKLRLINVGGEPIYKSDVELYKKHFPQSCLFVNRLTASETATVSYYFVDKETPVTGRIVPVGYTVEDMKVMLLDDAGNEVRENRIGEIVVKSRYLSPCYWRKPELTKAAFQPDPEGGKERIYRTGDLGRMHPDGCLQHMGRKDFRVKIRGNRIEVTEIEMRLLDHAEVKEAVVLAQEEQSGDRRLVAYLVPARQLAPTVSELQRFLKEKLPDYMIPSAFVVLDALPLTPNGKVDRRALPAPSRARPKLDTPFVPPTTPVEEALRQIWAEVLSVDQVGIHDNFLDLGGHSLAATQVISRVIDIFRVELPVRTLLEASTIAGMAAIILQNMAKQAGGEELARMLTELESLSDEETQRRLADERAPHQ